MKTVAFRTRGLAALLTALLLAACGTSPDSEPQAPDTTGASSGRTGTLSGAELYVACEGCHTLEAGAPHGVGPNLYGIDGRPAGGADGYAYSPALAASDITWDRNTLTAFVLATESMVTGTWMLYHNHLTYDEVERLVDYLLTPP